jgi:hypothetical protein
MIVKLITCVAPAALILAAPAHADTNGYLNELDAVGIHHHISDKLMVNLGQAICADFAEGSTVTDIGAVITEPGSPFTPFEAGEIIFAAVDQICPRYEAEAVRQVTEHARIA